MKGLLGWKERSAAPAIGYAERDLIALGIATASIIMFVGTGGNVIPQVIGSLAGYGIGPDKALVNALLLNVALIIFGWRRYRQLSEEVKERRRAEDQARTLAETDSLTGLLNRRSFNKTIDELLASARQNSQCVAVMMIDIDNFKQINDLNGHSAGDQLLIECTRRLTKLLPEGAPIARIGGDEFACAVPFEKARAESIDQLAAAIVDSISQPAQINGVSLRTTASLGVTRSDIGNIVKDRLPNAGTLLEMADIAMYHAKRQGRNCHYWFEDQMADEMRYRMEIEASIRQGVARGEFVPYYEQQIDLQTGEVTGFEMLARWNSPTYGLVGPDIFIPIAEEIGVIGELSENLIAKALVDAKEWNPSLTLSVNISPIQLRDPWFSQRLLKILVEANFPPNRLEIEITESCIHENIALVRTMITSLKNQGIRVSLDDFGTGYSSIAQLRSLPFDRLKIDRSFVINLMENKDSAAIVHSIALLGQGLELPVTAEGIETGEILDKLREYGEIKGQGYLYGKPRPATEVHDWLEERNLLSPAAAQSRKSSAKEGDNSKDDQSKLASNG